MSDPVEVSGSESRAGSLSDIQPKERAVRLPLRFYLAFPAAMLLVFAIYAENLGFGLVGHDTYPIIAAAKVDGMSDLQGVFTEELMDGRFPKGHYYRPVLNLSFALEHALFGIEPWGYHLTDLLLCGACLFLLLVLLRSLAGDRSLVAILFAGLFFLTHPVQPSILAVPARRGDALCLFFVLLALISSRREGPSRIWAPALCTLLAVGAKETGVLAVPLIFVLHLLLPRLSDLSRLLQALKAAVLPAGCLLLYLLLRQQVLKDAPGSGIADLSAALGHALKILPGFQSSTYYPVNVLEDLVAASVMRWLIPALLLLWTVLLLKRTPLGICAAIFWIWIVLGWAIHGLAQNARPDIPWYALHTSVPFIMLAGLLFQESIVILRSGGRPLARKLGAMVCLLLLLFLFVVNVKETPPFTHHSEWHTTTDKVDRFFDELEMKLSSALDGEIVIAPPLPFKYPHNFEPGPDSPPPGIPCLSDYTVEAWADLVFPDRNIRVGYHIPGKPLPRSARPSRTEVLVLLVPRRM